MRVKILSVVSEQRRKTAKIDEFVKIFEIFREKVLTIPLYASIIVRRPKKSGFTRDSI